MAIETPIFGVFDERVYGFFCCGGTSVQNGVSPFGFIIEPLSHRE